MADIEVSESQVEELEAVREELESEYVGEYGYVRMEDVVQFLLDEQSGRRERARRAAEEAVDAILAAQSYQDLQRFASETEGVEPEGTADVLRDRLVDAYVSDVLESDERMRRIHHGESVESDATTETASSQGDEDDSTDEADNAAADGTAAEHDDEATTESDGDASHGGSESRLERMMGLLDEHDDKWGETESEQGKYEVVLPDGRTETVRTKDDVRALLFKHY